MFSHWMLHSSLAYEMLDTDITLYLKSKAALGPRTIH